MRKKRAIISEELADLEAMEEIDGLDSEQILRKVWLIKESLHLSDQEESYPIEFYKSCWDIVKSDIVQFFS